MMMKKNREKFSFSAARAMRTLFYDYFMVYGTNTIGDHDEVESLFFLRSRGEMSSLSRVVLSARTRAALPGHKGKEDVAEFHRRWVFIIRRRVLLRASHFSCAG